MTRANPNKKRGPASRVSTGGGRWIGLKPTMRTAMKAPPRLWCAYCNGDHLSEECAEATALKDRLP